MTLGTSIVIAAVLLSVVILFAVTKDRWNWKRIIRWAVFLPLGLAVIAAVGVYVYLRIEERPKPQNEFFGIQLRAMAADVKFAKGEPSAKKEDEDRWIYYVGSSSAGREAGQYHVKFKNGRVRFVLYRAASPEISYPYLLGFTIGSSYQQVQEKLGSPSHTSTSSDDLARIFSYDRLNTFFSFSQSEVVAFGIFDPQTGPVRFISEKSEPKSEK
jgi:hypothetical protein